MKYTGPKVKTISMVDVLGIDCNDCQFYVGGICGDHQCPLWIQLEAERMEWTAADWNYDRAVDGQLMEEK